MESYGIGLAGIFSDSKDLREGYGKVMNGSITFSCGLTSRNHLSFSLSPFKSYGIYMYVYRLYCDLFLIVYIQSSKGLVGIWQTLARFLLLLVKTFRMFAYSGKLKIP